VLPGLIEASLFVQPVISVRVASFGLFVIHHRLPQCSSGRRARIDRTVVSFAAVGWRTRDCIARAARSAHIVEQRFPNVAPGLRLARNGREKIKENGINRKV